LKADFKLLIAPQRTTTVWQQADRIDISASVKLIEVALNPLNTGLVTPIPPRDAFLDALVAALEGKAKEPRAILPSSITNSLAFIERELNDTRSRSEQIDRELSGSTPGEEYVQLRKEQQTLLKEMRDLESQKIKAREKAEMAINTPVFHIDLLRLRTLINERRQNGSAFVQQIIFVNWEIFPASEGNWEMALKRLKQLQSVRGHEYHPERLNTLRSLRMPEKLIVGKKDFDGYQPVEITQVPSD
jgi:hypothetical protein